MLNPRGQIFLLREYLFNYLDGQLFIETDGAWNCHDYYPTYKLAMEAAEEIVDEYYAMCEPLCMQAISD